MDLSKKLVSIAENEQKAADANVQLEQILYGTDTGGKSHYDLFWDEFQVNGTRGNYICAFGSQWTAETFKPKYPVCPTNAYFMFFDNAGGRVLIDDFVDFCEKNNVVLDFSRCGNMMYALACLHSTHFGVLDLSVCTNMSSLFYSHNTDKKCVNKIDKIISSETTRFDTTTFQHAIYLTDIKMTGVVAYSINFQNCPLNVESMKSVISCLKNYAGTNNEFTRNIQFSEACLTALEADGNTSPNNNSWLEYIEDLGWLRG